MGQTDTEFDMLDVHPPEHNIRGLKDFFLHLFTITCGLLIALGLENAVAAVHHHHERTEAEESIRSELTQNRSDATAAANGLVLEIKNIRAALAYVEARSENKAADASGIDLSFSEGTLANAAWNTAASTGTLRLMPQQEVERFAAVYKEQDLLQTTTEQALNDYFELATFAPPGKTNTLNLSPEAAQSALPYVRHTLAHLEGMYAVGRGLLGTYDRALEGK